MAVHGKISKDEDDRQTNAPQETSIEVMKAQ
jgi:hypothetical protein